MVGNGCLDRNDFLAVFTRGCGGLERTDFQQFALRKGVVLLKELIYTRSPWGDVVVLKGLEFNNFYFEKKGWSCKD